MNAIVDTVVKVGGGIVTRRGALEQVALALEGAAARRERVLVVPGGGPFADTVRRVDRSIGLDADAAHWMAILGMEQYAHLLASRITGARLVAFPGEIAVARDAARLPVLAPYRWLWSVDPLPHSWDATSDSIAAWVAGEVGASRLVLVKPIIGDQQGLVDPYFDRALPGTVRAIITDADEITKALRRG